MNRKKFVTLLVLCLIVICSLNGQEQKVIRDLALWNEIKLSKKVVKNLDFSLGQHLRFNKNISAFDDYIFELELEYSINKKFAIGTNGRYNRNKHYDETVEDDYRYDLYFKFDTKLSEDLKLYYRLKYQKEFYDSAVFNKFLNYYETAYRNRIKLGWNKIKNHSYYTSAEIFRLIKKSRDPYYSKYRIFVGDDISVGKNDIDIAFGYEHYLNANDPFNLFIIKTVWQFKL